MWPGWLDKRYLLMGVISVIVGAALACGSAAESTPAPAAPQQPTAAPAAPQQPAAPAAPRQPQAPAPAATVAAPAPSQQQPSGQMEPFRGTLVIAVGDVNVPNGLPRFCSAGCAENVYYSGQTEVLFNSKANPDGTVTTEPMLALSFELDPSLKFGTFQLRQGVQFHNGWGEMTADDVVFSFNDANSVTNPESIHGQAGDFAPLIQSMEALDPYTVRLNYRNYDSRGILHRFSMFWQTAGIVSKKVFDTKGVQGMQDDYTGVGPFVVDEWTDNKGKFMHAFQDYYGRREGLGPFVERLNWLEVPESASRRAMLETGEAQIIQVELKDVPDLQTKGFREQRGALYNVLENIAFTGNYWERFGALTGEELQRDRDTSKPWVGNPFESGPDYNENTPSMQRSMKVRNAFAHTIERQKLVDNLLLGLGWENHQAYLSVNDPNHKQDWKWDLDFAKAKQLMSEAGYPNGFEMDWWVGTGELQGRIGEAVGSTWLSQLGVKVNLIKTVYSTYRPGLVARTTNTPFIGCGDENKSNFPYDWAHGFVKSSISAGGYGVGMEVPFATETYFSMAAEPDKARREQLSERFYSENRRWALCVGIFERPLWSMYNPNQVVEWDQRPAAEGTLGAIMNVRSVKLR